MKTKELVWLVALVFCYAGIAYGETVLGTVTSIDSLSQNVTVRRADTNATVTVHVTDVSSLNSLTTGRHVSLDANKNGSGWEARSFTTSPDSSDQALTSNGTRSNSISTSNDGSTNP